MKEELLWLFPWFVNTDSRSLPSCCPPGSHGCAFAGSGEHHKPEDSPEGAWGTASHHGRADLQFWHECRIPPPPQSWSHQWKLASAHWEGQVSSRVLSRQCVIDWEVCFQKWQLSKPTNQMYERFLCFHLPFAFSVSELFGQWEGKKDVWKWKWALTEFMWTYSCKCSAPSARLFHHLVSWYVHFSVWVNGQGAVFRSKLLTAM